MLPSKYRLRSNYNKIYKDKSKIHDEYFILFYKENLLNNSRFGFVIRKRLGKAHLRNLVKRRFRYIVNENLGIIKEGYDFIFLINPNLKNWEDITYLDIKKHVLNTLEKINNI